MRFAILPDHKDFFKKKHFVEFENMISPENCHALTSEIQLHLGQRVKTTSFESQNFNASTLFKEGRDLWRDSAKIKQTTCYAAFGEIAAELVGLKSLRLAYDQALWPSNDDFDQAFNHEIVLEKRNSFQPLALGLCLCLETPSLKVLQDQDLEEPSIFPRKAGNATFFSPHTPISLKRNASSKHKCLLIGYAPLKSVYVYQKNDLNTHYLKRFGYVFGDKLKNHFHPTILW